MTETSPSSSTPSNSRGSLRFALTVGAWFVGLFGLMRLAWVERNLLGLFAALWLALGLARSWRRALAGIGLLALLQAVLLPPLGELAFHFGLDPHVGLSRTWAIAAPLAMVWLLWLPATAGRTPPLPTSPLPQPG